MELSKLQTEILEAPYSKVVVTSAAGSGKTRLLTEKVRQILRAGYDPHGIAVITFTNMAAAELKGRLGDDYKDGLFIGTIHGLANYMLSAGGINTQKVLDEEEFDKLFSMIVKNPHVVKHLDWILLDEAQDSDPAQFKFLFEMINPEYFFVVCDIRQCQPAGTKILLWNGEEKNIEDVEIGDEVISYDLSMGHVHGGKAYNAKNYKILQKEKHFNDKPLIKVTLENGKSSIYTPEHKCIVNITDIQENFLVYLMCDKNNRFRIGKSQFSNKKNHNIYRSKMLAEECTKVWILKTFKTDKEARVFEDKISYLYQIPQITFQLDKTTYTKEDVDYIYEGIDTYSNACRCLKDYNKDINFPFCSVNDNNHFASNAYNICHACNLQVGNMNMLCYNPQLKHRKESSKIVKIEYLSPEVVYSLDVETNHTYVADGIITHNSIYRWRGATPAQVMMLTRRPDVKTFDMNENYRNDSNILAYAKSLILPTGEYDTSISMTNERGSVIEMGFDVNGICEKILTSHQPFGSWAILTRTNQEISSFTNALRRYAIPFDTFKQGDLSKEELNEKMEQDTVKLLTVHSAKGLEWDNVVALGMRYYNVEERCICYVAATRARHQLIWIKRTYKKKRA